MAATDTVTIQVPISRSLIEDMTEAQLAAEIGPLAAAAAKKVLNG